MARVLRVRAGDGRWAQFLPEGVFVLGASEECDFVVLGEGVGERHVRLWVGADGVELEDLGTKKVTLLNGVVVQGRMRVDGPVTLLLGSVLLELEVVEEGGFVGLRGAHDEKGKARVDFSYDLKRRLAKGGMAGVFLGEDPVLGRDVAVKMSLASTPKERNEVLSEAQLLARLEHPNIVPVYAMGRDGGGEPFYSMKLVHGRSLSDVLDGLLAGDPEVVATFSRKRLLTIFRKACDGIAFAHAKGVLHRDLKPENLMLGEYGEVLVMDWGLAQMLDPKGNEGGGTLVLESEDAGGGAGGKWVEGSPQYMSPEQVAGEVLDERSDVYALGGILFAILMLRAPVAGKSVVDVLAKVRRGELRPMKTVDDVESAQLGGAKRAVPLALRAVVMKAMALDRKHRYRSVLELAVDVEAYENGFATDAEHAGVVRQLVLWVRRNKAIAAMLGVMCAGGIGFALELMASQKAAMESARLALEQRWIAEEQRGLAESNERRAALNAKVALKEKETVRRAGAKAQLAVAEAAFRQRNGEATRDALLHVPEDLRDDVWDYLTRSLDTSEVTVEAKGGIPFGASVPHPKETGVYFTVQQDGWVRSVDVRSGEVTDLFQVDAGEKDGRFYVDKWTIAVNADASQIAIARVPRETGIRNGGVNLGVYRVSDGEKVVQIVLDENDSLDKSLQLWNVAFSRDGSLLFGGLPREGKMWNAQTGELLWRTGLQTGSVKGGQGTQDVFSPDGRRVMIPNAGVMEERDAWSGSLLRTIGKKREMNVWYRAVPDWSSYFSLQNEVLSRCDGSDGATLWQQPFTGGDGASPGGISIGAGYLPKGDLLVAASGLDDKEWAVISVLDGKTGAILRSELCFGAGGRFSGGMRLVVNPRSNEVVMLLGRSLKIWKFEAPKPIRTIRAAKFAPNINAVGFLGDSRWMFRSVYEDDGPKLELLDLQNHRADFSPTFTYHSQAISAVSQVTSSQDGKFIALGGPRQLQRGRSLNIELLRNEDGKLQVEKTFAVGVIPSRMCLSPQAKKLWLGYAFCDLQTGKLVSLDSLRTSPNRTNSNGHAWVGEDRFAELVSIKNPVGTIESEVFRLGIALWNVDTQKMEVFSQSPAANCIGVSPDGNRIAEGGSDFRIRIRDARTLEVDREFRVHDAEVVGALWHPRLPLLVTMGADHTVKVWDSNTFQLVETIRTGAALPIQLCLSSDGVAFAVRYSNSAVDVWEPASFSGKLK
ncbi:MAG: protein kinase [Verrucomicrobiota bacterium]